MMNRLSKPKLRNELHRLKFILYNEKHTEVEKAYLRCEIRRVETQLNGSVFSWKETESRNQITRGRKKMNDNEIMQNFDELKKLILIQNREFKPKRCILLFDALDEWYNDYKVPNLKTEKSLKNIETFIRLRIKPVMENKYIHLIDPEEVQRAINQVKTSYLKKQSFNNFNNFFTYFRKLKLIANNPMECLTIRVHKHKSGTSRTEKELSEFLKKAKNTKYYFVFKLYLITGARKEELLKINRETDIDHKNKILYIHGTKSLTSDREFPINSELESFLKSIPKSKNEMLFDFTYNSLGCGFKRIKKQLSFGMRLHDLRHTFATGCKDRGMCDDDIADLLGHADSRITKKIYLHKTPQDRINMQKKMEKIRFNL